MSTIQYPPSAQSRISKQPPESSGEGNRGYRGLIDTDDLERSGGLVKTKNAAAIAAFPSEKKDKPVGETFEERQYRLKDQLDSELSRGLDSGLSIQDHTIVACWIDRQGPSNGQYLEPMWTFIRVLQCHPQMFRNGARWTLREVEKALVQWGRANIKSTQAQALEHAYSWWFDISVEDARAAFGQIWKNVRRPYGTDPLTQAFRSANSQPKIAFHSEHVSIDTDGYRFFLTVAAWLQVATGRDPIMLPVHKLAELMSVAPKTISYWRKAGIDDGFLRVASDHIANKEATRFRFHVARIKLIRDAAHADAQAEYNRLEHDQ